jgi:hypothetical protein
MPYLGVSVDLASELRIPNEMSQSNADTRQQLLEARALLLRQIEILESGPVLNARGGGPDFEPVIAKLEADLKEIEDCLAELGEDDGSKG